MAGILIWRGEKVGVRKRVSFEGLEVDEKIPSKGKEGNEMDEMDEQVEHSRKGDFATEGIELVDLVLDTGLPMSSSQKSWTA